ncbi:MAG: FHA domain-containing protein, partial [Anaerolineae bacterium]
ALAKQADRRFRTSGEFARALAQSAGIGAAVDWDSDTAALNREVVLLLNASDGREFPVCRGTTTIGRDTGSDIVLPVRQVSRHHARIRCDEKGCRVVDPGSTNGTLVNGVRIPPETPWSLRPDDVLTVGPMKLLVTRPSDSPKRKEFRTLNMDPSQDRKAGKR